MDRQAGFLVALLFLANVLTIEADGQHIQYIGNSNPVTINASWTIMCESLRDTDVVKWNRDGNSIESEIQSNELTLTTTSTTSTIRASSAKPSHNGIYKCTLDSAFGHNLTIQSASDPKTTTSNGPSSSVSSDYFNLVYVLEPGIPLFLVCNTTLSTDVQWQRNNVSVSNNDYLTVNVKDHSLVLNKTVDAALGNYTCKHNDSSTILSLYRVVAKPTAKLPPNTSVVEGEKLHLVCQTSPAFGPEITWRIGDANYTSSSDRFKITKDEEQNVEGAVLIIENIRKDDFGDIYCHVNYKNVFGDASAHGHTYLRVKDKLAALWPFLGICAEVIILCAIILIYEKKRNKAELDESDTDQSPDTKPTPNKDSEVRHRK